MNSRRVQPKTQEMTADVYSKMAHLLRNDLDLLDEFTNFLPEMKEEQQRLAEIERVKSLNSKQEPKKEPKVEPKTEPEDSKTVSLSAPVKNPENATPILPSKRKTNSGSSPAGTSSKKRLLSGITLHEAAKYATDTELIFFQKVQNLLKETDVYHQFLKCISKYSLFLS